MPSAAASDRVFAGEGKPCLVTPRPLVAQRPHATMFRSSDDFRAATASSRTAGSATGGLAGSAEQSWQVSGSCRRSSGGIGAPGAIAATWLSRMTNCAVRSSGCRSSRTPEHGTPPLGRCRVEGGGPAVDGIVIVRIDPVGQHCCEHPFGQSPYRLVGHGRGKLCRRPAQFFAQRSHPHAGGMETIGIVEEVNQDLQHRRTVLAQPVDIGQPRRGDIDEHTMRVPGLPLRRIGTVEPVLPGLQ
jgi:hypothetical protein